MKNLKYLTVPLIFLLFVSTTSAMAYDIAVSVGNLCEFVGKIQTNDSGKTNVCSFNPYLASSLNYKVNDKFILAPEIGLFAPKHGRDKNISKMSFYIEGRALYTFSMFHLIGGAGFFFTQISGPGGVEDLNNGSETVSFPMPDSTAYSQNFIIDLGLGYDVNHDWGAELHTFIFNLLKSEDRAFSIAINGVYHFGEF